MKSVIIPCGGMLMAAGAAWGAGYYLPNQDAGATAMGNAFVATADNAAAVHYNPAGLTQLAAPEVEGGVYAIRLGNEAEVGGSEVRAESEWQLAPNLYYAQPLNDRLVWGIGLNSPFGLGTNWGRDTPFSTVITEARLMHVSATGALGWQVTDEWSVGASLSVNYSDLLLEQAMPFPPGSFLRFEGDDVSVGGALATRWAPHEQHSFGLLVSLETSQTLEGRLHSNIGLGGAAEFDFMTPLRAAAGYAFRPAPGWSLAAGVEWLDWDALNTLKLRSQALGVVPVTFNWESMFIWEAGLSYTTDDDWVFAAGYDYNSNAQPDANYNPAVADADRHWFNAGVGRTGGEWNWFLTYQFGYSNRTVDGAPTAFGQSANGKYKARHHALVFSLEHPF